MLNMPFEELKKDTNFRSRSVSSYHDKFNNETDTFWFTYKSLCGVDVIIAGAEEKITENEMLSFMVEQNGFAMSRDNLFMMYEIYKESIDQHIIKTKSALSIVAMAHHKFLPAHNNGPLICPMLDLSYDKEHYKVRDPNHDWSWIDNSGRMEMYNFAFFRKTIDCKRY